MPFQMLCRSLNGTVPAKLKCRPTSMQSYDAIRNSILELFIYLYGI